MKRKSRDGYKTHQVRPENVSPKRPPAPRECDVARDGNVALDQEGMLAKALQSFQLDRHASYTAQVENVLREAIVRGHLPPGTSLSEAAISATLGISRTPAREALALLADEQLVLI